MSRRLIALLSGGILFIALPAFAQINSTGTSALTISANPTYPGPDSTVTLTAESPLLDLADSTIQWSVDGKSAGTGQSIQVPLGGLGQETDVAVSVSGDSGSDSASLSLIPASLDLLWEANSYVPPFYQGRALPGSGSTIRVMALEDSAGKRSPEVEGRFAREHLDSDHLGVSYWRYAPGFRSPRWPACWRSSHEHAGRPRPPGPEGDRGRDNPAGRAAAAAARC